MRHPEQIKLAEQRDAEKRRALTVRNALDELIEAAEGAILRHNTVGLVEALIEAKKVRGPKDVWPGDPDFVHSQSADLQTFAGRAVLPRSETKNG